MTSQRQEVTALANLRAGPAKASHYLLSAKFVSLCLISNIEKWRFYDFIFDGLCLRLDRNRSKAPDSSPPGLSRRSRLGGHSAQVIGMAGTSPAMTKWGPPRVLSLLRQRRPGRLEVAPREPLFERRAQQIGRVEGRDGANFPRAGMIDAPPAARPADALGQAEQRGGRRAAEAHQDVGIGQFDLALDERQADPAFLRGRRAGARGAAREEVGHVGRGRIPPPLPR